MKPKAPQNVTLSGAKSLNRPGFGQNDRLAFLTKPPPQRVSSFGLRPQHSEKGDPSPLSVTLASSTGHPISSEGSLPARLQAERAPGVLNENPALLHRILGLSSLFRTPGNRCLTAQSLIPQCIFTNRLRESMSYWLRMAIFSMIGEPPPWRPPMRASPPKEEQIMSEMLRNRRC